jgi:FSR family fosmidomycin resistance protein-like MFS transporter
MAALMWNRGMNQSLNIAATEHALSMENGPQSGIGHLKIVCISVGHLCHDIYTSFLAPILPLLMERLALTYSAAGFLSVLMRLPALVSPLIGTWADRRSLKYLVIISPALTAVAMCLMGAAPHYYVVAALAMIAGASSACFHVPAPVLLKGIAGDRPGAAMSLFQVGGELSRTIGPLVVLGAISWWSFEAIYRLIPLGVGMSFFLHWALRDHDSRPEQPRRCATMCRKTLEHGTARHFFMLLTGILLCKSFSASVIAAYLPVYLTAQGASLWLAGSALALLQGVAIAGVFISGTLSDILGCKRMLVLLTAATPVAMLLFVCSGGWLTVAALVLLGLTAFSSTPVMLSLIQQQCPGFPATANGMYMMLSFMLGSLTVLLAGMLSDRIGIDGALKVCAVCAWAGLPLLYYAGRKKPVP